MCEVGYGESPKLFKENMPKARKLHRCCECGSDIAAGDVYQKITGLWDEFHTFKTCSLCAGVREKASGCFGLSHGECFPFEQLWDCVGFDFAI